MSLFWALSFVLLVLNLKCHINCGMYSGVMLLGHSLKIVERVLLKKLKMTVKMDGTKFTIMPEN